MKLRNICRFAVDGIIARKKTFLFTIIILVTAMVMMNLTILQVDSIYYTKLIIQDAFNENLSDLYYIKASEDLENDYINFIQEVIREDNIDAYGFYKYAYNTFEELKSNAEYLELIAEKNVSEGNMAEEGSAEVLYMDASLIPICNIYDTEGDRIKSDDMDGYIPIYIGYNYKDIIPVGTILTGKKMVNVDNKFTYVEIQYKVKGVLRENSKWLENINIEVMSNSISLDNLFVTFQEFDITGSMGRLLYTVKDDSYAGNMLDAVFDAAGNNGLLVKAWSVENEINYNVKDDMESIKVYIVLAVFITLISVLATSSISSVSVLLRKKDYGIMYANGLRKADVRKIVLVENIIKILISFIMTQCYILYELFMTYGGRNQLGLETQLYLQFRMTIYQMLGIAVVILAVASIVPLCIVNRLKVTELIGGND